MLQAASYRARVIDVELTVAFISSGDLHLFKCSCSDMLLEGGEKRVHLADPHSCPDSHRWHPSGKSSETMQVGQKRIYEARQGGGDRILCWLVPLSLLPGKQSRKCFFKIPYTAEHSAPYKCGSVPFAFFAKTRSSDILLRHDNHTLCFKIKQQK